MESAVAILPADEGTVLGEQCLRVVGRGGNRKNRRSEKNPAKSQVSALCMRILLIRISQSPARAFGY